ncbi:unnamed protein product [Lasius platythorax]|uniref:Uncharacterized protein n=1 Tax=Lasius platythorax TaxID=488582 RepID=A0AAV2MYG3_9HYME
MGTDPFPTLRKEIIEKGTDPLPPLKIGTIERGTSPSPPEAPLTNGTKDEVMSPSLTKKGTEGVDPEVISVRVDTLYELMAAFERRLFPLEKAAVTGRKFVIYYAIYRQ